MQMYLHLVNIMIFRDFWSNRIEEAWEHRSIIWLSGVRRVGKTSLCQSLKDMLYFDCELPSVRRQLEDPELFLEQQNNKRIILDEIHRLDQPSELLKIAADHYPNIKIVATGSSTLGASSKFGDTLTGRKQEIWLTPMLLSECAAFGKDDIAHRMLFGGLPPFFCAEQFPEKDFSEWLDSYWAKDIQELFRLEKRHAFFKLTELLFAQSGSIFEANAFTGPCEVSRPTIHNYVAALEATFMIHILRPFNTRLSSEIVSAPKIYGFDTGFVSYAKNWHNLRPDDMGLLWEHVVLNELCAHLQTRYFYYWRSKQGHEIDFVYFKGRDKKSPIAIECKWNDSKFKADGLMSFRKKYPAGTNYVVAHNVTEPHQKQYDGVKVTFIGIHQLIKKLIDTA